MMERLGMRPLADVIRLGDGAVLARQIEERLGRLQDGRFGPDVAGCASDNSRPWRRIRSRRAAVGGNGETRPLRLPMLRNR
jgi:hypothetical protein